MSTTVVVMTTTANEPAGTTTSVGVPAVRLSGAIKDFGSVHAVRGIDLEVQQGEIVAFLGPPPDGG